MKRTVSATEARVHFGEMLRAVSEDGETYVVERGGKPQAIVISPDAYSELTGGRQHPDWMELLRRSQEVFRPLIESGKLNDLEELIREEREKRDEQLLEALR